MKEEYFLGRAITGIVPSKILGVEVLGNQLPNPNYH